ncbi:Probable serine/threonine-protein kinase PBL3 [Linum perenne]
MSRTLAGILGGAGALALLVVILFAYLIWTKCASKRNSVSRTSDTGSSDPSVQAGRHAGVELSIHEAKRFDMEELSLATKNFSHSNLIGLGKFGEVYKGLLDNGMLVAVKKRFGAPTQDFVDEVRYLSAIQHRNIVTLLGYCQENSMQFLIYEYVPSGSVSSHLYGSGQVSKEKLEFKHRLAIALGAAKGLDYLHSLRPRLVHKNFKTANVLVDENFIAKVADAGLRNFLARVESAGPSSQVTMDEIFLAPEVREFRRFSEKSDVYSFGVFLVELISGREATEQNMVEWKVQSNGEEGISSSKVEGGRVVDERLGSSFTAEGMEELMGLAERCLDASSERRPAMSYVVTEVDRILEKEMKVTTGMGEGAAPTVTLGSQLFRP